MSIKITREQAQNILRNIIAEAQLREQERMAALYALEALANPQPNPPSQPVQPTPDAGRP